MPSQFLESVSPSTVQVGLGLVAAYAAVKVISTLRWWATGSGTATLPHATPSRNPPSEEFFPQYMMNKQGMWLHWRSWRVVPPAKVKGVVFVAQGLGHHSDRYELYGRFLNRAGYHLYVMDHQGQGCSEGQRKYVEAFQDFVDDFAQFITFVKDRHKDVANLPTFLIGHSMGGLISALLSQRYGHLLTGVVLKAPALAVERHVAPPWLRFVSRLLSSTLPRFPLPGTDLQKFTSNDDLLRFSQQDPLNTALTPMCARFGNTALEAMTTVMANAAKATTPLLILHGDTDNLTPLSGSQAYISVVGASDATLTVYDNCFHDFLHCRKNSGRTQADIVAFFDRLSC